MNDETETLHETPGSARAAPQHPERVKYLDGWRGMAILAVLVGHFIPVPGVNVARMGVELFFVLSGRLMADILLVQRVPLGYFYFRRFSRVWPALAVFVAILALYFHLPAEYGLSALTFTINYLSIYAGHVVMFDHIWSLCIEEHCYIVLGIVAALVGRDLRKAAMVIGVLALACCLNGVFQTYVLHGDYYAVYWRSDVRAASIFLGFLAFLKFPALLERYPDRAPLVCPALLLLGAMLSVRFVPDAVKYTLGAAAFAGSVCALPRAIPLVREVFEHPILTRFGLWSYSLYIWQQLYYELTHQTPPRMVILALPLALITGIASFYLVEQPLRRFINQYVYKQHMAQRTISIRTMTAPRPRQR